MSLSLIETVYTGGSQVFPTNFALGILEVSHVTVTSRDKVDGLDEPLEYDFTYDAGTGDITVTDTLTLNERILIKRSVPKEELYVEFISSDITPRNIDNTVKQALMAVHEVLDQEEANRLLAQGASDDVAALEETIATDLAAASAAADDAEAAQAAAEASATSASGFATNSLNAANLAGGYAIDARDARDDARDARDDAETAETGAVAAKNTAVGAASTATTKASEASTSAGLAQGHANTASAQASGAALSAAAASDDADDAAAFAATASAAADDAEDARDIAVAASNTYILASQAEAEAGTENTKYMSPLRVKQSVTANAQSLSKASAADISLGTNDTRYVTPARAKQAVELYAPVQPNWTQTRVFSPGDNVSIFQRPVVTGRHYRYRGWNVLNATSGSSDREFTFTALHPSTGGGFTRLLFLADLHDVRPFHFDILVEHVNGSTNLYVQAASNAPAITGSRARATVGWNKGGIIGPINMAGNIITAFEFKCTNSTINDGAIDEYEYFP